MRRAFGEMHFPYGGRSGHVTIRACRYASFELWTPATPPCGADRHNATLLASCNLLEFCELGVENFLTVVVYDVEEPAAPAGAADVPALQFAMQPPLTVNINESLRVVVALSPQSLSAVGDALASPWFMDAVDVSLVPLAHNLDEGRATAWAAYFSRNRDAWDALLAESASSAASLSTAVPLGGLRTSAWLALRRCSRCV